MYKFFLCLRYLRKRRIAFFAVGAVCLCVAMVLIVFSVMDGFLQNVKDRSRGMLADLVMDNGRAPLQGFPFYQEFIDDITGVGLPPAGSGEEAGLTKEKKEENAARRKIAERIHQATPVITTYALCHFPEARVKPTKPVQLVGIRLKETYEVNDFKKGLFYEKYYPGTTNLGVWREPCYGINDRNEIVLPPELEEARKEWEKGASQEEIDDAWRKHGYAFRVKLGDYARALNRLEIPPSLLEEFDERGYTLGSDARVIIVSKALAWRIESKERSFLLRREDDEQEGVMLEIFFTDYLGPGYYLQIPWEERVSRGSAEPIWRGDEFDGVIVGTDLIALRERSGQFDRKHWRGERIILTMMPISDIGKIAQGSGMPSRPFRIVDDCRTGVYEVDSMSVYVDFDVLQPILEMDERDTVKYLDDGSKEEIHFNARATQIQIKLKEGFDPNETRDLIEMRWEAFYPAYAARANNPFLLDAVRVRTWQQMQRRFTDAVEKEKILVLILFGIISLVAVLLVGCVFYMIVQQKTRDIGIIKSVGASSWGVAGIFIAYGAAVGVVGGAGGIVIGALFVHYINEIQALLMQIHPTLQVWNPEVYTFDRIPNQVELVSTVVIYVVAVLASVVGSVVPAIRAARIWPVEALRYE